MSELIVYGVWRSRYLFDMSERSVCVRGEEEKIFK